jgi:3-methyladenine DNA glycosylase AlkC
MTTEAAPALKDWFDANRFHSIAGKLALIEPRFDRKRFLNLSLDGLDNLTLLQRLRRMSESTRAALPLDYEESLEVLRQLAPLIDHGFVTLFLPDFVSLYGHDHFDTSMEALKGFTPFGSSEFAIREFLKRDLHRTLAVMHGWSHDPNEHVRRLASEGCRPRLPWSFRLPELIADPSPALAILENLRADSSLYVRKSVANHLNDISRDNPDITLSTLSRWDRGHIHTAWIAKRALRTLIKEGHVEALTLLGAGEKAQVRIDQFLVSPARLGSGGTVRLDLTLTSRSKKPQKLLIDYVVHYVKQSGGTSEKVFKWKELDLAPCGSLTITKRQTIRDFTTRQHYPGKHRVEVQVNGERLAEGAFELAG